MENRATIIAKGEVQRVGYRDTVERIARKAKLKGFVKNIKPYDIKIVVEGEKSVLDSFIKGVRINKFPIFVEDLEVKFGKATGEFKYFEIKRGDWKEELGERMDSAGHLLYRSVELGEKSVSIGEEMLKKQDKMLGKQDEMLEKQDETIGEIRAIGDKISGKQDKMLEKQDKMLGKQDEMLGKQDEMLGKQDEMLGKQDEIIGEIRGVRYDLKTYMEKRFGEIEDELSRIKSHIGLS